MAIFRHIRHPHRTWSEFQTIQDLSSLHEALRDAEAAADELTTDTHRRLVLVAASMGGWIHGESMYIYYVWYIIYIYNDIYVIYTMICYSLLIYFLYSTYIILHDIYVIYYIYYNYNCFIQYTHIYGPVFFWCVQFLVKAGSSICANHTPESYPESYPRIIPPNHTPEICESYP